MIDVMPGKTTHRKSPAMKRSDSFSRKISQIARNIRLLIVDVDGVLTDGGIILDDNGNQIKKFHVRDGHGIKLLQRYGIEVAIITGRSSLVVGRRAKELGIRHVYQKSLNKIEAYEKLKKKLAVSDLEVAYVGDDVVDIPVMKRVAFSVAVADAHEDVLSYAHYVTALCHGRGRRRMRCQRGLRDNTQSTGIMGNHY